MDDPAKRKWVDFIRGFGLDPRILGLAVLTLYCGMGCAQSPKVNPHARLIAGRPFEPDVPVPARFNMVEQASEDRSTGTNRLYLRHVYHGQADKFAIRNFYRQEMPLARWTKVSDGNIKGVITMRFEKGDESCTVNITDAGTRGSGAEIQVVIAREQRGNAPPTGSRGTPG
jgi:hypothetical protein